MSGVPERPAAVPDAGAGGEPERDREARGVELPPAERAAAAAGVAAAYDRIAALWTADRARTSFGERRFLDRLVAPLAPGAEILDAGCGSGAPIARELAARGFRVTGLDASPAMLALVRRAVPEARLVLGDLRTADPGGPFDAAVAWDSLFHLPAEDQTALFGRLARWLRPGGRLLVSLGGSASPGFVSKMHGERFFYAAHEPDDAVALLAGAGFRIEHREIDDPASRGHLAVLAVRR